MRLSNLFSLQIETVSNHRLRVIAQQSVDMGVTLPEFGESRFKIHQIIDITAGRADGSAYYARRNGLIFRSDILTTGWRTHVDESFQRTEFGRNTKGHSIVPSLFAMVEIGQNLFGIAIDPIGCAYDPTICSGDQGCHTTRAFWCPAMVFRALPKSE